MFISESQYIGFDTGKSFLRIAKVCKTRQGWDVSFLKEIASSENAHLLDKHLKEGVSVSCIQTREVLSRSCEIPLKKIKDIFAALDFHVEPLLPYPIDKAVIQAQITGQQDRSTSLIIHSVRKDHLQQHLDHLKENSIEPEIVTTKAHAFAALSSLLPQTGSPLLIVHESEEEITLVLIEKGQILAARAIENKKHIGSEIQKALLTLTSAHKAKIFDSIYFFGKDPNIRQSLQIASGKAVLVPTSPFLSLTQDELIQFGLAIGCALAHQSVNFRQKEFAYPHPFRRFRKPLTLFFSLSLLFTASLYAFSEISLARKKQSLSHAYATLLEKEGKGHAAPLRTPEAYLTALASIEKEVNARPSTFPLLPQVPKVKEALSWLASIQGTKGIVIESLHYQMVKRPDFSNRLEKYKVRLDLELGAPDAQAARFLHDALKNPNPFVDTTEELQWLPIKGKYKASFYLRDKTKYD